MKKETYLEFIIKVSVVLFFSILCICSAVGQDMPETAGERNHYDSAHFSIIVGKYKTGEKFLRCYMNRMSNLDSWTTFYKNGQVKEQGTMTYGNHIYVGVWRYYNESGVLDSLVDFNAKYPISYFNAIDIAKKLDFPTNDISETKKEGVEYWEFAKWRKDDHQVADILLVNKLTGETVFPDYIQLKSH